MAFGHRRRRQEVRANEPVRVNVKSRHAVDSHDGLARALLGEVRVGHSQVALLRAANAIKAVLPVDACRSMATSAIVDGTLIHIHVAAGARKVRWAYAHELPVLLGAVSPRYAGAASTAHGHPNCPAGVPRRAGLIAPTAIHARGSRIGHRRSVRARPSIDAC